MKDHDHLFREFEHISADEWLDKITFDLKGKERKELDHAVSEDLVLSPFHHADTKPKSPLSIARNSESNEWLIGENFTIAEDLRVTNKEILHALTNGVQAIHITIERNLKVSDFQTLFEGVEPSYIYIQFLFLKNTNAVSNLSEFVKILSEKKGDKNDYLGSMDLGGADFGDVRKWTKEYLPGFKVGSVNASFGDPVDQLTALTEKAMDDFKKSEDTTIAREIVFKVKIGTDFFLEIAKLRALRIIWANVLKSYELAPDIFPTIIVEFDAASQTEDPNQNMIRATTMAMAAALGGADQIIVAPANITDEKKSGFYRRIARNVQHILKMESFVNRVNDVANGSYYVETLTTKIGEAVWKKLGKE